MDNEVESTTAALASSSTIEIKWAPFILLGPLLPSMFAVMLIVVGEAVVKANVIDDSADIACGYPIDRFVEATIGISYIFLAVFTWSFLGFETHFTIRGRRRRLLRPFSSLAFVAFLYLLLFVLSLVIWGFGTWAIWKDTLGNKCASTVPSLYMFSVVIAVIYWVGVLFGLVAFMTKLFENPFIVKYAAKSKSVKQMEEVEMQLVAKTFDGYDEKGVGLIDGDQAKALMEDVAGIGLSRKNLKRAMAHLDRDRDGMVAKNELLRWYAEIPEEEEGA